MRIKLLSAYLLLGVTSSISVHADTSSKPSSIVSQSEAQPTQYDGSVFYTYSQGDTVGIKDHITGVAVIEPGKEIHPAHKHAEEEFLMIIEGEGEWTLNGKKLKAKTGDILYAAPWDMHGVFNSGDTPLKFVVMKWSSKGLPTPKEK